MATQISLFDSTAKLSPLLRLADDHPDKFEITVFPSMESLSKMTVAGLTNLLVDPLNFVTVAFSSDEWNSAEVLVFGLRGYHSIVTDDKHLAYVEYEKSEIENYAGLLFTPICVLENNMDVFMEKVSKRV
ncbi:hypothetical protein ACNO5E_22510 [Vibrio parahaemolyticus]|uniref:hypothetical protein n=1 Tax=Vibrio parahaemolyticus TaxID=670 RepID=UPI000812F48D|nr:hypothetical protein [Vibrio parahaemolyticus]OCP68267.1 hypothetical protein AKH08_15735 [Vibrio parahaemolyticus]